MFTCNLHEGIEACLVGFLLLMDVSEVVASKPVLGEVSFFLSCFYFSHKILKDKGPLGADFLNFLENFPSIFIIF